MLIWRSVRNGRWAFAALEPCVAHDCYDTEKGGHTVAKWAGVLHVFKGGLEYSISNLSQLRAVCVQYRTDYCTRVAPPITELLVLAVSNTNVMLS